MTIFETDSYETDELYEGEYGQGEYAFEEEDEAAFGWSGSQEGSFFGSGETDEVYEISDETEEELAMELLSVSSEEELDQFLGKLVSRVAKGARALVKSPIGKALGGVLKKVAKTALPMVGSAIGSHAPRARERYAASITCTEARASSGVTTSASSPRTAAAKFSICPLNAANLS